MEQEQQPNQQAQPLYYIEQPNLSPLFDQGQTVSIRKKIGEDTRNRSSLRKEKKAKKRQSEQINLEATEEKKEDVSRNKEENVEESTTDDHSFTRVSSKRTVKEMLEYIESLPHYIQPIIACETKHQYVQGTLIQADNGEIIIKDRRNLANKTIKESEITEMYIVSL
ncbi:hypothetical protein D7Z54_23700 [Salibacterium salarium]|uniref:Spore coat protein CotO n=1 Tax=Salibacterium salarium TaxID=284579 RepID=A0A3R9PHI7_9BACI|nr:hypothetical protein [Salibacterium salarium]RSL30803.1 hypothetical protein D7Z54_23700 [Salibacterium salarium]